MVSQPPRARANPHVRARDPMHACESGVPCHQHNEQRHRTIGSGIVPSLTKMAPSPPGLSHPDPFDDDAVNTPLTRMAESCTSLAQPSGRV